MSSERNNFNKYYLPKLRQLLAARNAAANLTTPTQTGGRVVTRSERQNSNTSDSDEAETPTTGNDHAGTSTSFTGPPPAHLQPSSSTTLPPSMRAARKQAQKNIVSKSQF